MSKKASRIIVLLALGLFLVTTVSLAVLLSAYQGRVEYSGEIMIESQEQYHGFLDAIFTEGVGVNALYWQRGNLTSLSTQREGLWVDYPYPMPAPMGFNLSATQNPLVNVAGTELYREMYGGAIGRNYGSIIYSFGIAMVGYGLTAGLWISRNGIYENPKLVKVRSKV